MSASALVSGPRRPHRLHRWHRIAASLDGGKGHAFGYGPSTGAPVERGRRIRLPRPGTVWILLPCGEFCCRDQCWLGAMGTVVVVPVDGVVGQLAGPDPGSVTAPRPMNETTARPLMRAILNLFMVCLLWPRLDADVLRTG